MVARSLLLFLISFGLSACLPSLGGWTVEPRRDDGDGGIPPPPRDAGPGGPVTGGPCGRPTLFAAVHDLDGTPGRVLRWEVQGAGGLIPCNDLTGSGTLSQVPWALAPVSDRLLLVASDTGVQAIDPLEDRELWTISMSNLHPNDAFVLEDGTRGGRVPVVAWSTLGGSSSLRGAIRLVETYADGAALDSWSGGDLMLGNSTAMAASPRTPTEAIAMNSGIFSAAEVALFGAGRRDPALVAPFADAVTHTVTAAQTTGGTRIAWTATVADVDGLYIGTDPWAGEPMLDGVGACESATCNPTHVVLDPTLDNAAFAVCAAYGAFGEVVRLDLGRGLCETWASVDTLGARRRPAYLAVLP